MATEEVKIFFKVEGLDGYITDLDDLKSALGGVTAETKQATTATEQLSKESIDSAEQFERRIQTLEGGVKVLAGSAEFAAGAIGLLGEENSEWFKEVEGNVLNIVALAQGAIDFSEGLTILSKNTKLATIAQRAFNLVAKANPYVLVASALLAAGSALLIWKMNADDAIPPSEKLVKSLETMGDVDLQARIDTTIALITGLRKAAFGEEDSAAIQAINQIGELEQTIRESKEREIEIEGRFQIIKNELVKTGQEELLNQVQEFTDEELASRVAYYENRQETEELSKTEFLAFNLLTNTQQLRQEQDFQFQQDLLLQQGIEARDKLISNDVNERALAAETARRAAEGEIETLDAIQVKTIEVVDANKQLMVSTVDLANSLEETTLGLTANQIDRITNFTDVAEDSLENFAGHTAQIFSTLGDLNNLFAKGDEKRQKKAFDINKAASLSQAIIAGSLAVNKAFTSQLIPGDPTSLPRAIGAAALAGLSAASQIATIARQQFNSPTPGSLGGGGGATLNYQVGGQQAGGNVTGQFSGGAGGTGGVSQTYVLAGDVTSQQQAEAQIQNLARL